MKASDLLGYSTMRTTSRVENGNIVFYSEVIEYDRNNVPIAEPKILDPIFKLGWSDGSPVTTDELNSLNKEK